MARAQPVAIPDMAANPFADPIKHAVSERDILEEPTLAVGKTASLTLAQDTVIILDEDVKEPPRKLCFPLAPSRLTSDAEQRSLISPSGSILTKSIPYYNILSATLTKSDLTLNYAEPVSKRNPTKSSVSVATLIYELGSPYESAQKWVTRLMDRAYGPSQRHKRIKVLINPYGGVGRAQKQYYKHAAPIFLAAGCAIDVETTNHRGHAIDIAEALDINQYDILCCASGDGLPMESFNGLARKSNASEALRKVAVVQLPCGSGNAMSWNLNGTADVSLAALAIVKGVRTSLDLASITQLSTGDKRTLSFLSASIGIIAESDLGTDNIRWMGDLRFTIGFFLRLLGKTLYPVDIAIKTEIEGKDKIKAHYAEEVTKRRKLELNAQEILDLQLETSTSLGLPPLRHGTASDPLPSAAADADANTGWSALEPYYNLGNFYAGNMCYMAADTPFFAASLPNDGMMDLVTIDGDIKRLKAVGLMLDVASGRLMDQEVVRYRKISAIRVIPRFGWSGAQPLEASAQGKAGWFARLIARIMGEQKEGYFSLDGEKLPFEPFQIEVHRGLGTVLSKQWGIYQYEDGPAGWQKFADTQPTGLDAGV